MLTKTINGTSESYSYNANDQLIQKGSITYTYDSNGNLISDSTNTYSYDDKNRLIKAVTPNETIEYTYDANDNRIAKTTSNGTTTYLVDASTPFAQVITESKSDGTEIKYTYGNDLLTQSSDADTLLYLTDAIGSTRALADTVGTITDNYTYSPYGALLEHLGGSDNEFLFTGEQYGFEDGLYYLRARYYNPINARFMSRDTYDGKAAEPVTQNHYLYGNGNPITYIDPSGHMGMMSMSNAIAITGILAGGSIVSLGILNNNRGGYGGNIQATIWMYNAKTWLYEEYIDFSIYWAGKAKDKSPFGHAGEKEALNTNPNDPCSFIKRAIEILEAQIAWRYSDIIDGTPEASGHYKRIKILKKHLEKLKSNYNLWCKK